MDKIHYAGETLVTGTDIARALLAYAQALAVNEKSATVDVPLRQPDGSLGRGEFLIGPSSQIIAESYETDLPEVIDEALVASFEAATRALGPAQVVPIDPEEYSADSIDDLDLPR
jgi:hypothetical protein